MNICLLTLEWPPYPGGIGTYMFNLAVGLQKFGHNVTVITNDGNPLPIPDVKIVQVPPAKSHRTLGSKILRWRWEPHHSWSLGAWDVFKAIEKKSHFDIVETAEYGAWARYFVRHSDMPVVVRCHTPAHGVREINENTNGSWKMPLWLRLQDKYERQQTFDADAIGSPSHVLANHIALSWGIPCSRFTVLPNLIDTELFRPCETNEIKSNKKKEILYVGRFQYNKGIFDLAESVKPLLKKYPEITVRLIGQDMQSPKHIAKTGKMVSDVIRSIIPREYHERVIIPGRVSLSELISSQQQALCGVVPSRGFESFSYTLVEHMSCGCAVVATHCGGPTEIITDGVDGLLVAPGDVEALTEALDRLIEDSNLREKLASNARKTVEKRFAIPVLVPKIVDFYEKVIKNCKIRKGFGHFARYEQVNKYCNSNI